MQISASNLLIASQQTQAPAQPQKAAASFASTLAAPAAKPAFEELPLKNAASTPGATAQSAQAKATAQPSLPGGTLDIRV